MKKNVKAPEKKKKKWEELHSEHARLFLQILHFSALWSVYFLMRLFISPSLKFSSWMHFKVVAT